MQRTIIIDNVPYNLNIFKKINTINIIATNSFIKNSYFITLNKNKLKNIVSNAGLIYDMDNFYKLFIVSLDNNNSKIRLDGKLNGSKIILNLSIQLTEYFYHTVNYAIVLDEMIIDVHQIRKNNDYLLNESRRELEKLL